MLINATIITPWTNFISSSFIPMRTKSYLSYRESCDDKLIGI